MNYSAHDPKRYAPSREQALAAGRSDFAAIREYLPPPETNPSIVELGCGCGNLLLVLDVAGYRQARGIDASAELAQHGRTSLGVEISHGYWTPVLAGTQAPCDVLIALDVVEHLPKADCVAALRAAGQMLRPNGRLILRTPNAECPFVLSTFHGDFTHTILFGPELLKHALREAGFRGAVQFAETRPFRRLSQVVYFLMHRLIMRPAMACLYFHFCRRWPTALTRNFYCIADR